MTRISVRLIAAATLTIGLAPAASATSVAPPTVCTVDAFGRGADGHLAYRQVVDARTTTTRKTVGKVGWTPLTWGLQSSMRWGDDWERRTYLVPAADGKVRLVETFWTGGGTTMKVTVKKTVRWNVETRLVASFDSRLYNVARDGSLHRRIWNGHRIGTRTPLGVKVPGARAITAVETDRGDVLYLIDRKGRLHLVISGGGPSTVHKVLRTTGYAHLTGIKAGHCSGDALALLQVNRKAGGARIQRHWFPATDNRRLGTPRRVDSTGWNWRYLG